MRTYFVLMLVAACGGGGPKDWREQPTETVSGTHNGHAFTIDLPKGMSKNTGDDKYDVHYDYHQEQHGESYTFPPGVSVSWEDKKSTLDDELKNQKNTPVHKDQTADGWVFAYENDSRKGEGDYMIIGEKFVGDGAFRCLARVWPMKKGEKDGMPLVPLVEKMCLSLKAK